MSSVAVPYQGAAAPHLVDVVVLAGGDSPGLSPLNDNERKVLVKLCNRPLIWFTLAPWVEAGFRRFFLCVHDDVDSLYKYLQKAFPDVELYFVLVPSTVCDRPSTTCDAVRYYVEYKDALRLGQVDQWGRATFAENSDAEPDTEEAGHIGQSSSSPLHHASTGVASATTTTAGAAQTSRDALKQERRVMAALQRDAVILSCDTLLSGIDLERFVSSFYSSMASASVMLYRPMAPSTTDSRDASASDGKKKGGKGGHKGGGGEGGAAAHPLPKPFTHTYTCAMYEEDDVITEMAAGDLDAFHNHCHGSSQPSATTGSGTGGRGSSVGVSGTHEDPIMMGLLNTADHSPRISHRRLHFLKSEEKALNQPVPLSMGFSARRPHMTLEAHLVDPHVYLLRHWVLRYIAATSAPHHPSNGGRGKAAAGASANPSKEDVSSSSSSSSDSTCESEEESSSSASSSSSGDGDGSSSTSESDDDELEDMSVQKTVLPALIANQHTLIDSANHVFKTPDQRLLFSIPQHWLHHGNLSIQLFNAAKGHRLPEQADSLRVFCTIFEDTPEAPCKAYRVDTIDNYRAVSDEILAAKCHALHLERINELPPEEVLAVEVLQKQQSFSDATLSGVHLSRPPAGTAPELPSPSTMSFHASVLPSPFDRLSSFLLPINPFTLKRRIRYKTLGVYISSSLLETAPDTTVRITRSIIGPNVKLGENVTIVDSILMGAVEIGDDVKITRSILCNSAIVWAERKVVNCVVGPMVVIDHDEDGAVIA